MTCINKCIDMNQLNLKWRNWNAWIEPNELTWMNWHEWIDMSELEWVTWHDWLEMKELKRMNWMNSNEWLDMNELKRMNWNEWIEMNDSSTSSWKSAPNLVVFWEFCVKSNSRYSLVHILCNSSSKSGPNQSVFDDYLSDQLLDDDVVDRWNEALATVARTLCRPHCRPHLEKVVRTCWFFLRFLCESELSLQSGAHFVDLIFKKCEKNNVFFYICSMKSSSRYSLVHILSTTFRIEPRNRRNRDPGAWSSDRGQPLYPKNRRFCARESFQGWIHAFPITHTSPIFDHDVIDMMMWLPWWWDS